MSLVLSLYSLIPCSSFPVVISYPVFTEIIIRLLSFAYRVPYLALSFVFRVLIELYLSFPLFIISLSCIFCLAVVLGCINKDSCVLYPQL